MGSGLGSFAIKTALLIGVTIAAAALYFAGLPHNPPGFYIDESSIAYNAHQIAHTGADEFGTAWPLYFRCFGDYKNPTYVYLLAGIFRLTSASILTARLLSATLGILSGATFGLLAFRLTNSRQIGWLMAATALMTPWFFETSRVVMEVAMYPLLLGLFLLCLHWLSAKEKWSWPQCITLAVTLALLTYTYSIGRLFGPMLALGLALFWKRGVARAWCAYGITLVPLIIFNDTHPGALTQRFKIITYLTPESGTAETILEFCKHYFGNLDLWRMLVRGDSNRDQVAHIFGTPHFLFATFVFAGAGLGIFFRNKIREPWWLFVFYGLLVAIVPASLTNERFHMLRLIAVPIFLLVFATSGLSWIFAKTPRLATALLLLTGIQAAAFQWKYHVAPPTPWRLHLFDAQYRERIFQPAVASNSEPIYIADALAIPGYIQAYWYATLAGIERRRFVKLPADESPPNGALVISTEENCPRCQILAKTKPYTLYVANAPARERVSLPDDGFRAELSIADMPKKFRAKKRADVHVRVKNISAATWLARERSGGNLQVSLGNHWLDQTEKTVVGDDGRSALLCDLPPGEETELRLTVNAPRQAGDYILEIDMLQEDLSWFALKGSTPLRLPVHVE